MTSAIRLEKGHYEIPCENRGLIIKTKYLGPTNYRGSRIKALHKRDNERTFSKTIDWDYAIQEDTLVTYPPELLGELRFALNFLSIGNQEMIFKMGKSAFNHLIDNFLKL